MSQFSSESRVEQNSILLMTDSASDIPQDLIRERNIAVVPLGINIGGKEYKDGIDISSREFYRLLKTTHDFPETSPPAHDDFHKLYLENIGEKDILGIFLSRRMSRTCEVAKQTVTFNYNSYLKRRRKNPTMAKRFAIEIIDSGQVSMGAALLVLEASDKIREGWPLIKIKKHIEKMIKNVQVFFMVDNLDYLARGGRIGRGSAFLGNLFGFKPILNMVGGGVNARGRAFGGRRAQRKLIEYMKSDLVDSPRIGRVGICHADSAIKAATVQSLIRDAFPNENQIVSSFGPVVGSHLGPGAVGVAWFSDSEEK